MADPTTTTVALNGLLTKLLGSIKDRKFAAELREIQGMVHLLTMENLGLKQDTLNVQAENAQLKELVASLQNGVAQTNKEDTNNGKSSRIHKGVMFRKSAATGQKWMPFCPVCDTLLQDSPPPYSHIGMHCPKFRCGFRTAFPTHELDKVIAELGS